MMSRVNNYILFILFLCGLINFCPAALAEEDKATVLTNRVLEQEMKQKDNQEDKIGVIASRPKLDYKSTDLRDPFETCIITKKKINSRVQGDLGTAQPKVDFSDVKVQGIIWGTKMPQAIIDNKVYIVGDKIKDAEIVSIDKEGVNLSTVAGIVNLAAPG